jgi:hypothetical protein
MNVLTPPRASVVDDALAIARVWCSGHTIDGGPALRHACAVAVTLGSYYPDATPELIAAALLHDGPEYAGEQLDRVVTARLGPAVLDLIRAVDASHVAMGAHAGDPGAAAPELRALPAAVLAAVSADKVVALRAILDRAARAPDRAAYWRRRQSFLHHVPYFRLFATVAAERVPAALACELDRLVSAAERALICGAATGRG